MTHTLRLGVNIDHVATLRNARGGVHPDPVAAALLAMQAGADGITAHLREDRRHIRDTDMRRLKDEVALPLNFEMAATGEMLGIALAIRPNACCLVPEKREERTTEGGLDVAGQEAYLKTYCAKLKAAGIRTSLFIDPVAAQVEASARIGADIVELHTGAYAEGKNELGHLREAAKLAHSLGLEVHAGHGLTFANVALIAAIPEVVELNIGHFLIGEAVMMGLKPAIQRMRRLMDEARA
jgi:pyridoxine 5-phosphate synthase